MFKWMTVVVALIISLCSPTQAQAATIAKVNIDNTTMTVNGVNFTPRGANYIRLTSDGAGYDYISTFEPGLYDSNKSRNLFSQLAYDKYNTVRTFIDIGNERNDGLGSVHGMGRGLGDNQPINNAYMDNVADFIKAGAEKGIYTVPVLYRFPQNCYYYTIVWNESPCNTGIPTPNVEGRNAYYFDRGFVKAKAEYLKQFSTALISRLGNTNAIPFYSIDNEAAFFTDKAPFSSKNGSVIAADGVTYKMDTATNRQKAADNTIIAYTKTLKAALRSSDPTGKIAIGVFTPYAVGKTGFDGFSTYCQKDFNCSQSVDYRYPARAKVADVDIIDVHFYPRNSNTGYSVWNTDLRTAEVDKFTKLWYVGEMGAHKSFWNGDITSAAYAMNSAQNASCLRGAKGSLFWTFDTHDNADQRNLFTLTESAGAINGQLAPIVVPKIC